MKCECGCGQEIPAFDSRGRKRRFVHGHYWRGKHRTETTKTKLSYIGRGEISNFKGHKHTDTAKEKISEANRGRKHTKKTKNKISNAQSGKNSSNWQGGISFEPYCAKFNNTFKESVRDKFGRTCFICGIPENGRKLDVHHIDYNKMQGCEEHEWKLVPLCRSCHSKTSNGDRANWENMILEKLGTFIN